LKVKEGVEGVDYEKLWKGSRVPQEKERYGKRINFSKSKNQDHL
jgi:hypothetical protein